MAKGSLSVMAISPAAARVSFASAATFLVLLAALHLLKPELDPSWRMISEYAIGRYGGVMALAFLAMAVSCVALVIALRSQVRTLGGSIGLLLLLVAALGLALAATFTSDPITATPEELTTRGNVHALAAGLGTAFPIAAALISWSLARRNEAWSAASRSLLWAAGLTWIGILVFIVSMAILIPLNDGRLGPQAPIGWPNRFMMLTYALWLMVAARCAIRLRAVGSGRDRSFGQSASGQ